MTATTFTFFKDGSKGAVRIYRGNFHEENLNQPIFYRIKLNNKAYELYDERHKETKSPILKAKFTNLHYNKGIMEGFNMNVIMNECGFFINSKWVFMDPFQGNKSYTWKIDLWCNSWKLRDDQNRQAIASFERAGSSFNKQGVLTIYYQVSFRLLAYIILSHKLLHQNLKSP